MLTLLVVVDDATKHLLYAQLVEGGESTAAIMTALREVLTTVGLLGALYTDRAGWAVYTPTSSTAPDRTQLAQVGRCPGPARHRAHPRALPARPRPQRAGQRHPAGRVPSFADHQFPEAEHRRADDDYGQLRDGFRLGFSG
jgi:hypothetical protein